MLVSMLFKIPGMIFGRSLFRFLASIVRNHFKRLHEPTKMRRTHCSLGRIKPTKFLMTTFFLSIVYINWSYLTYESSRFKLSARHNEFNQVNTSKYKQIERFLRGGYTVSRINEVNNIVTIELVKEEKNRLDFGNPPHENLGSLKIVDAQMVKGSLNVQAKMRTSWRQPKEKDIGNQSNSKDESEANIDVTDVNVTAPIVDKCPNNTLGNIEMLSYGRCKPHKPTLEGCREAQRQFYYDPKPCTNPFQGDICTVNVYLNNETKMLQVRCNKSLCDEGRLRFYSVKTLNPVNGEHDVIHYFSTIKQLEHYLPSLIVSSHKMNNYNYVILRCRGNDGKMKIQLLPISPRYTIQENKATLRDKNQLSVNIVLIDSVARDHFYRSLPKTIQTFKHLSKTSRVFDFELFQAVEGHTAENTHALFTGSLFPPSNNRDAVRPVGMEKLFRAFKREGYQTMWQEDLCWKGYWGLLTDLAISYSWRTLAPKLKQVYIDHTGLTHSSCEVLKTYKLVSPFLGPSDKICYNGKYQHSYFLDYIEENLRAIDEYKNALPLLSYTSLSVGHDSYGRRIQTMDHDLWRFVERMAKENSTLTILLADHGNTYTSYTVSSQEGKFEMFHPSLFFVIPDKVGELLGQKALETLYENQRRLVTMVDLHHSIMALARPISPQGVEAKGVFGHIPYNRTCDEVELRTPNMCVCEGWDSPTTNDTLKLAFAEFAIGQLNNLVTKQAMRLPLVKSSCHRLQPSRYENVRVRNRKSGGLVTSMDIIIAAGDVSTVKEDIYHVEIHSKESIGMTSLDMKLNHFEKLTPYGVYSICRDEGVNRKLCVCSKRRKKHVSRNRLKLFVNRQLGNFQGKVVVNEVEESECLFLIKRIHGKDDAHAYEVANICTNQSHGVLVTIKDVYNMKTSHNGPIEVTVPPGSILFLLSAMKDVEHYEGNISVNIILVSI